MARAIIKMVGEQKYVSFYCLGCRHPHSLKLRPGPSPSWEFNNNADLPTLDPSVHVNPPGKHYIKSHPICHSYVRNGQIEYLADSTHAFSGQTIDLPDYPEEWE